MGAEISVRYQLLHNSVAVLHKFIGPDYLNSVIDPEIGSQARQVISQYTAEEVYTSREAIQKQIRDDAQRSLAANLNKLVQPEAMEQPDPKHYNDFLQNAIQILDTLVLSIELPPEIVAAINRQTEQYYMINEYKFRVQREAEESKRKQIEADGIAAFQKTVSQGISESVSALARHRGDTGIGAVAQHQDRDHRLRQRRAADHSRQRRSDGAGGTSGRCAARWHVSFSGQYAANAGAECGATRAGGSNGRQGARGIVRRGDAAAIGQGRRRSDHRPRLRITRDRRRRPARSLCPTSKPSFRESQASCCRPERAPVPQPPQSRNREGDCDVSDRTNMSRSASTPPRRRLIPTDDNRFVDRRRLRHYSRLYPGWRPSLRPVFCRHAISAAAITPSRSSRPRSKDKRGSLTPRARKLTELQIKLDKAQAALERHHACAEHLQHQPNQTSDRRRRPFDGRPGRFAGQ